MLCNVIDVAFSDITSTLFLHPYFHYKKCLQDKERCVCWTNEDILRPSCVNSSYYLGQFPAVDVTNYHTFCCCKQEKAPHSWLWRTGVQIQVCTTTSSPHSLQGRGQGPSTAFRAEDRVPHAFRAEDSLHPIAFRAEDSLPPCPQTSGQSPSLLFLASVTPRVLVWPLPTSSYNLVSLSLVLSSWFYTSLPFSY